LDEGGVAIGFFAVLGLGRDGGGGARPLGLCVGGGGGGGGGLVSSSCR